MAVFIVPQRLYHLTDTDAAVLDGGKRKREGEDDMAALEAAVAGTRLQGFVSGGTVQPDQRTQEEACSRCGRCAWDVVLLTCLLFGKGARSIAPVGTQLYVKVCSDTWMKESSCPLWNGMAPALKASAALHRGACASCGQP